MHANLRAMYAKRMPSASTHGDVAWECSPRQMFES
jgi:hypothetical protein